MAYIRKKLSRLHIQQDLVLSSHHNLVGNSTHVIYIIFVISSTLKKTLSKTCHLTHIILMWVLVGFIAHTSYAQPKYDLLLGSFRDTSHVIRYSYNDISCSNDSNCTTVGYFSNTNTHKYTISIERTTNGGKFWIMQLPNLPDQNADNDPKLTKVFMIDSLNIVAAGDTGWIFRTTDAGQTWNQQQSNLLVPITDINFSDSANGIAISPRGFAVHTTDAGNTWIPITNLPRVHFASCKAFSGSEQSIFRYGHGPIYHTSDSWGSLDSTAMIKDTSTIPNTFIILGGIYFFDPMHAMAYGVHIVASSPPFNGNNYLASTSDGGLNWTTLMDTTSFITQAIGALAFTKNGKGIATGFGPGILYSSDYGVHWKSDSISIFSPYDYYYSLSCPSDNKAFLHGTSFFIGGIVSVDFSPRMHVDKYEGIGLGTKIYPNPSDHSFTLSTNISYDLSFGLYDILGRQMKELNPGMQGKITVFTDDLPSGAYRLIANYQGIFFILIIENSV